MRSYLFGIGFCWFTVFSRFISLYFFFFFAYPMADRASCPLTFVLSVFVANWSSRSLSVSISIWAYFTRWHMLNAGSGDSCHLHVCWRCNQRNWNRLLLSLPLADMPPVATHMFGTKTYFRLCTLPKLQQTKTKRNETKLLTRTQPNFRYPVEQRSVE